MEDQGRVMLRAAMESLFNLRAIACSETTAHRFLEMDELQRNRALGKWERLHSYHSRPEAELRLVEELRKELKETIEKKDIKGLTTEDISRLAGMHDWYLSVYTVLSDAVHSRVRDLERHVVADKEGQIVGFRDEPTFDDLQDLLLSNAEILELAMDSLCQVFPELGPLPSEKHKKELQDLKAIRLAE
jgi:hypothetical protein